MEIERLILGEFETNCYIVRSSPPPGGESATDCLIIDTGLDAEPLLRFLAEYKLDPKCVILTHGHIDHIAGVNALRAKYPSIKVFIHKLDADLLSDDAGNLSFMTGRSFSTRAPEVQLEEGDTVDQAGIKLDVIHTPGHTPGGICLYAENEGVVFVGDTLFAGSIGRTDFPNGSMTKLVNGIKEKLLVLPDQTKVYPGHGPPTTIANEKSGNPFL